MRHLSHWSLTLVLALAAACAQRTPAVLTDEDGPRPSSGRRNDIITRRELEEHAYRSVYDVVSALRANWLAARGPDTILGQQGEVVVRLDEMRYGGIESMRSLPVMNISYIQYFDPISASGRWGLDHGHGAIVISTHSP